MAKSRKVSYSLAFYLKEIFLLVFVKMRSRSEHTLDGCYPYVDGHKKPTRVKGLRVVLWFLPL
jgi:hypothetical protein